MVRYIMIYDHLCVEIRKSEKRKENIWIQALKTTPIRTALNSWKKKQKNSMSNKVLKDYLQQKSVNLGISVR